MIIRLLGELRLWAQRNFDDADMRLVVFHEGPGWRRGEYLPCDFVDSAMW